MNIKVGTAPDSWGVWFPSDPVQPPWQQVLDEAAASGYQWIELGPYGIRVNTIHPWAVDSQMAHDSEMPAILEANPTYVNSFGTVLTEPAVATPDDIANAVVWLASDAARCVTGVQLPIDMGATKV